MEKYLSISNIKHPVLSHIVTIPLDIAFEFLKLSPEIPEILR